MSAITSDSVKSKSQESSSGNCTDHIKAIAEHWFNTANDEFGFGVIYGLRLALEILEGKR
jgi:hypothetical protein